MAITLTQELIQPLNVHVLVEGTEVEVLAQPDYVSEVLECQCTHRIKELYKGLMDHPVYALTTHLTLVVLLQLYSLLYHVLGRVLGVVHRRLAYLL